jgi:phage N-6-adenine-methyltransferase
VNARRCGICKARFVLADTGRPRRYCSDRCRVAAWRKLRRRSVHYSSKTCEWSTPPAVFAELDAEYGFNLDPCATAENAKCERYFTARDDGLAQTWTGRVFMNPPYGRLGGGIEAWMRKAWEASQTTAALVVCLVPARTDTAWWHDYARLGEVKFLRGRLRFGGGDAGAPFPSAVVVFRNPAGVTKQELAA